MRYTASDRAGRLCLSSLLFARVCHLSISVLIDRLNHEVERLSIDRLAQRAHHDLELLRRDRAVA